MSRQVSLEHHNGSTPRLQTRHAPPGHQAPIDPLIAEILVGDSPGIRRVRALVARLAPTQLPVHVHGPTGSGKELVARALHIASRRAGKLVALNVCAIADGVFEATLFGHVRGAFTGAIADVDGMLLEAHDGTVFLDEIGGLAPGSQAKLLRAIELREFRPVGARKDKSSQFRLISATNDDLDGLVARGTFRDDLLHRLRGAVISLPTLAERNEDIGPLARHFVLRATSGAGHIDDVAIAELRRHRWPGNVRELLLVVQCAVALADGEHVNKAAVLEALDIRKAPNAFERSRHDVDVRALINTLELHAWDIDAAARELGVHRTTIYRRMRKLGVQAS